MISVFAIAAIPLTDTQSALSPAGVPARDIHLLWQRTLWMLAAVYVITVLLALTAAWWRRSRGAAMPPVISPGSEKRLGVVVSAAVVVTTIILFVLLVGDFTVGNHARALGHEKTALEIEITGHQWWWEIRYRGSDGSVLASDANEVHVPTDQTVRLTLKSGDVIHSFWAPNFSGKKDLIPGHPTALFLKATQAGTYSGQCAEFCGYQHAKMRFAFVAQPGADFSAGIKHAGSSAPAPASYTQQYGMQVFMTRTCSMCHTIQGTPAGGRLGPDLTHIASRAAIAAGSLPNAIGHLAGWIADPQGIKPGVRMPQQQLSPDELQAVLEYLETLK
jgi:cytochrome c oxidase subunit 2